MSYLIWEPGEGYREAAEQAPRRLPPARTLRHAGLRRWETMWEPLKARAERTAEDDLLHARPRERPVPTRAQLQRWEEELLEREERWQCLRRGVLLSWLLWIIAAGLLAAAAQHSYERRFQSAPPAQVAPAVVRETTHG